MTTEGRVEVLYGGMWGTICDDMWDYRDAQVVCRQLGFPYAVAALSSSVFGEGEGAIWMDNVECNGTEKHIGECRRTPLDNINCVHSEDAGIMCSSKFPQQVFMHAGALQTMCFGTLTVVTAKDVIAPISLTMLTAAIQLTTAKRLVQSNLSELL